MVHPAAVHHVSQWSVIVAVCGLAFVICAEGRAVDAALGGSLDVAASELNAALVRREASGQRHPSERRHHLSSRDSLIDSDEAPLTPAPALVSAEEAAPPSKCQPGITDCPTPPAYTLFGHGVPLWVYASCIAGSAVSLICVAYPYVLRRLLGESYADDAITGDTGRKLADGGNEQPTLESLGSERTSQATKPLSYKEQRALQKKERASPAVTNVPTAPVETEEMQREAAATKIQAVQRGQADRKSTKSYKEQRAAKKPAASSAGAQVAAEPSTASPAAETTEATETPSEATKAPLSYKEQRAARKTAGSTEAIEATEATEATDATETPSEATEPPLSYKEQRVAKKTAASIDSTA